MNNTLKEIEEEIDNKYNLFKDIVIAPRQAGDFDKAIILQEYYRNYNEDLKSFIKSSIIKVLEQLVERERMEKKLESRENRKSSNWDLVIAWNAKTDDTISYLKSEIDNIKNK